MRHPPKIQYEFSPIIGRLESVYLQFFETEEYRQAIEIVPGDIFADRTRTELIVGFELLAYCDFDDERITEWCDKAYFADRKREIAWLKAMWPRREAWELK